MSDFGFFDDDRYSEGWDRPYGAAPFEDMQYEAPPTLPSDKAADVSCAPLTYVKDKTTKTPRRRRITKRAAIGAGIVAGATGFSVGMYEWSQAADHQSPPPLSVCGPASASVNQTAHDRNLFPGQNGTVGCMAASHRAWPGDNQTGSAFWSNQTQDNIGDFYLTYDPSALSGDRYGRTEGWKDHAYLHDPTQKLTRLQTLQAPNVESAHGEADVVVENPQT